MFACELDDDDESGRSGDDGVMVDAIELVGVVTAVLWGLIGLVCELDDCDESGRSGDDGVMVDFGGATVMTGIYGVVDDWPGAGSSENAQLSAGIFLRISLCFLR
jgi:hypothetical protein